MFACSVYELTPEFEENITREFIDNIKRLRHHASLGLWCGNNADGILCERRGMGIQALRSSGLPLYVRAHYSKRTAKNMTRKPFTGLPALPQGALLTNRRIQTVAMYISGKYGTTTNRFPNTGNITSVTSQNLDFRHSLLWKPLKKASAMSRRIGIFSLT